MIGNQFLEVPLKRIGAKEAWLKIQEIDEV